MADVIFRNLLAYSAQSGVLAGAAAAMLAALRLREPALRLRCLRVLLGALLVLPLAQPWRTPQASAGFVEVRSGPARAVESAAAFHWPVPSLAEAVLAVVAA